jgi:flagellar basal body-associated protein FliL
VSKILYTIKMVSRWVIITLSAIIIASALVIGITYFLLKKSDEEERAADEVYLRSKTSMLKAAVDNTIQDNSRYINVQSSKILENVNSSNNTVQKSTSKLSGLIARQKAAIAELKKKYMTERKMIK